MFLKDKLNRKYEVKKRIDELRALISKDAFKNTEEVDEAVRIILNYLDELQDLNLLIRSANNQAQMDVGESRISLNTAVEVRNTLNKKLGVINDLIYEGHGLNMFELLDKRNGIANEYNNICRLIDITDWSVKLE
jgi:hypothetical protein